jgi:hypothetical protein
MNALFVAVFALFHAVQEPLPVAAEWSRLRVTDDRTAEFLRQGIQQSAILRGLVDEVEEGEVMVYLGSDNSLPGRQTGRMILLGDAGGHRYLKVSVRRSLPAYHFIAALAHELQHVREIIDHPEVRDAATLAQLYQRIGNERLVRGNLAWETNAARQVTFDVRRELLSGVRGWR